MVPADDILGIVSLAVAVGSILVAIVSFFTAKAAKEQASAAKEQAEQTKRMVELAEQEVKEIGRQTDATTLPRLRMETIDGSEASAATDSPRSSTSGWKLCRGGSGTHESQGRAMPEQIGEGAANVLAIDPS